MEPVPSVLGNGLLPSGRAGLGQEQCALSYPRFGGAKVEVSGGEAVWDEVT